MPPEIPAFLYQSLALTALLAGLLSWLIRRWPPGAALAPAAAALTLALPWIIGHLRANGLNYFFPPAAGVDWLISASVVWMLLMVLCPVLTSLVFGPEKRDRLTGVLPASFTLVLAVTVCLLAQNRLQWVFRAEEAGTTRALVALAIALGGGVLCLGFAGLGRLLPAAGLYLCVAALAVPLAASLLAGASPVPLTAIQLLPAAAAAGFLLGGSWGGKAPVPVALWCGLVTGLPFLWGEISRFPSSEPLPLALVGLLPGATAILLYPTRRFFHPAGLSLTAAAILLSGGTWILRRSPPPPSSPAAEVTGADDSGAYD